MGSILFVDRNALLGTAPVVAIAGTADVSLAEMFIVSAFAHFARPADLFMSGRQGGGPRHPTAGGARAVPCGADAIRERFAYL